MAVRLSSSLSQPASAASRMFQWTRPRPHRDRDKLCVPSPWSRKAGHASWALQRIYGLALRSLSELVFPVVMQSTQRQPSPAPHDARCSQHLGVDQTGAGADCGPGASSAIVTALTLEDTRSAR
ncbi:hypothetical protein IG631_13206 [Alternaria alternata]|nr:hypothetical protein IG631_13206 [Alternaria alternata]